MSKIELLTEKLFSGTQFCGVWERYISTVEGYLRSGFEIPANDKKRLMEYLSAAYEQIGDKAESFAWKSRAMAEYTASQAKKMNKEEETN